MKSMNSIFHSALWKATLLGSQQVLALPITYYMIVAQLERHGLVDVGVFIQSPGDDFERGSHQQHKRAHNAH
jgi:hypothetical protein